LLRREEETMHSLIHPPNRAFATVLAAVIGLAVITAIVLLRDPQPVAATHACEGVQINPGNDLDAIVNRDPSNKATTFCVHAAPSGTTYTIDNIVQLRSGDKLLGQPGQVITRGPASYGVPPVKIRNGASLPRLIVLSGSNVHLSWLDVAGAAVHYKNGSPINTTGFAITAGQTNGTALLDATARMEYLAVHDNPNAGINSMNGKLLHSNLYNNGTNTSFHGWTAAAVKGVDEYEAAYNYVHDNPAVGLWCDHECADAGTAMPNGFWVHHNLLVNNGRWGVRYEYSPIVPSGVHASQPTALIESNEIHANGYKGDYGGASMGDAQNATFSNNVFGAKTIAGVSYRANNKRAIYFGDSGRSDRTDLWNGDAVGNFLGGEPIVGCEKPDDVVFCLGNL
jgi:hypothetical protein